MTPRNGTVEVATLRRKEDGSYILAVVHVDRDGQPEIVGLDYSNMDAAKRAAWALAQQFNAVAVSTKRRAQP